MMKSLRLHPTLRLIALLPALLLAHACTEVELCEEATHPHSAHVVFDYTWNDAYTQVPDSMVIAAVRVMNLWKCGIICNHLTDSGRYIINVPEAIPLWANPETYYPTPPPPPPSGYSDIEIGDFEPVVPTPTPKFEAIYQHYALREGTYKFVTMNHDTTEFITESFYKYIHSGGDMELSDVRIAYKTYEKSDTALKRVSKLDIDEASNPGYRYIQPDTKPLYMDTVHFTNIYKGGQENRITFSPTPITQNIDLYVGMGKKLDTPFRIDSVLCELSGIPIRISPVDGYVDISETAKIMFWTDFVNADHDPIPGDTYTTDTLVLHKNLNVTGIVTPKSTLVHTGPGILIMRIFATAKDSDGNEKQKSIVGSINLYNSLRQAKIMEYTEDFQHVQRPTLKGNVNVRTTIKIQGSDVVKKADENGGFDIWDQGGNVDGDPSNPIEI